ncbi:hypothetical protein BDQ17DRAFT_1344962 [Cyathus striatus]|nr:hypothetical protein BDQ17DRAFT_1344962 [Cyathus striatus]
MVVPLLQLVAYCLSFGLYGVFTTQVYAYYICFPKDKKHVKILVYGVLVIETIQSILVIRDAVTSFGIGFGERGEVAKIHNEWLTMPIASGIIGCIVQCFYAYRIKRLTHTIAASCFVVLLALVQCIGAIVAGVEGHIINNAWKLNSRVEYIAQAVKISCFVIVHTHKVFQLYKSKTKVENTQATLTRIIRLIIGTGIFTALIAILDLILYLGEYKRGAYFLIPCLNLGKLYSNSMMVVLNNRANIVSGRGRDAFGDTVTKERTIDFGEDSSASTASWNSRRNSCVETRVELEPVGQK